MARQWLVQPEDFCLLKVTRMSVDDSSRRFKRLNEKEEMMRSLTNYLLVISLNLYLVLIVSSGLRMGRDAAKREKR
jgi:hypothetical protein